MKYAQLKTKVKAILQDYRNVPKGLPKGAVTAVDPPITVVTQNPFADALPELGVNDGKGKVEKADWQIAVGDVVGIGDLVHQYIALVLRCKTPRPVNEFWEMQKQMELLRRTLNERKIRVPAEETGN